MNDNKTSNTDPLIEAMMNSPDKGEYAGEGAVQSTLAAGGTTTPSASRRGGPALSLVEADNAAALRASDVRTTGADASPSCIPTKG